MNRLTKIGISFSQEIKKSAGETNIDEAHIAENLPEQEILIQKVFETLVPKLVAEDIPLLFSLLSDVFPNVSYTRAEMTGLKEEIRKACAEEYLICGGGDEQGTHWMEEVKTDILPLHLYFISSAFLFLSEKNDSNYYSPNISYIEIRHISLSLRHIFLCIYSFQHID